MFNWLRPSWWIEVREALAVWRALPAFTVDALAPGGQIIATEIVKMTVAKVGGRLVIVPATPERRVSFRSYWPTTFIGIRVRHNSSGYVRDIISDKPLHLMPGDSADYYPELVIAPEERDRP